MNYCSLLSMVQLLLHQASFHLKTVNVFKHDLYTSRISFSMLKIVLIKENLKRWEKK